MQAFDTGPHSDITRDALIAEGFGATATEPRRRLQLVRRLYSSSSKIPQSGHADTAVSVLGAFFENDEKWPERRDEQHAELLGERLPDGLLAMVTSGAGRREVMWRHGMFHAAP